MSTLERIERILRDRFQPARLELHDESERHRGHPGATGEGGHYRIVIAAAAFAGRSRLERHRMVYEALGNLLGREIHALALRIEAIEEDGRTETAP